MKVIGVRGLATGTAYFIPARVGVGRGWRPTLGWFRLWEVFLGGVFGSCFWELFWGSVFGKFFWEVFLGGVFGRCLQVMCFGLCLGGRVLGRMSLGAVSHLSAP